MHRLFAKLTPIFCNWNMILGWCYSKHERLSYDKNESIKRLLCIIYARMHCAHFISDLHHGNRYLTVFFFSKIISRENQMRLGNDPVFLLLIFEEKKRVYRPIFQGIKMRMDGMDCKYHLYGKSIPMFYRRLTQPNAISYSSLVHRLSKSILFYGKKVRNMISICRAKSIQYIHNDIVSLVDSLLFYSLFYRSHWLQFMLYGSYSLFALFFSLSFFRSAFILFAHQKRLLLLSEGVTSISIFSDTIFWHTWSIYNYYCICKAVAAAAA